MKKELPIDYEIGFADSHILSFFVENRNVTVLLKCWNAMILKIKFFKFISLFSTDDSNISNFLEIFNSPLLDSALDSYYEIKSEKHPFRSFKFITPDEVGSFRNSLRKFYHRKFTPCVIETERTLKNPVS